MHGLRQECPDRREQAAQHRDGTFRTKKEKGMKRKNTMTAGAKLLALVLILVMVVPGYFVFADGLAGTESEAAAVEEQTVDASAEDEAASGEAEESAYSNAQETDEPAEEASGESSGSGEEETAAESTDSAAEPAAESEDAAIEQEAAAEEPPAEPAAVEAADAATPDPLEGCDFAVFGMPDGAKTADYCEFDEASGVLTIKKGGLTVAMAEGKTTTSQRIVVAGDGELTIDGLSITAAGGPAIKINAGVTSTLTVAGSSTVTGASGYAGIEVGYSWNGSDDITLANLTLDGAGSLHATGGSNSAGIGGSYNGSGQNGEKTAVYYGNITIAESAGTIIANGNGNGAGIGSSGNNGGSAGSFKVNNKGWGTITINGGIIKATGGSGGNGGTGIGGGNHVDSGLIIINGGDITAEGSAGIGCGFGSSKNKGNNDDKGPGYYFATIEIHGGTITAAGKAYGGAGIGGSAYGDAHIVITDGTITAIGGGGSNYHHGAAGIGGGYLGDADIEISGGTIVATGGCAGAGIGSGGSPNAKAERGNTGRSTEEGVTYISDGTTVKISGGYITANGGEKGGAGIGGGVGAEKVTINISDGTVLATGAKSSEADKAGGAGIGSGYYGLYSSDNAKYFVETDTTVTVTGGEVLAIGGWGASGIGSGADNTMADTITIDAKNATIEAYADGTKFAIDTRDVTGNGGEGTTTTSHTEGRTITGSVLQGTFVHVYTSEDNVEQGTEGLSSIQVINDQTGDAKELTKMPEGYRSFATNVSEAGTYSVYSDAEEIAEGGGRYFNKCTDETRTADDVASAQDIEERNVQYQAKDGEICDNFYLFPVKTVVVTKDVQADDSIRDGIDQTLYFGLWNDAADVQDYVRINENGQISYDKNDPVWVQTIEVVGGVPQGSAAFAGIDEGEYAVSELDKDRIDANDDDLRMQFGTPIEENSPIAIVKIETTHGESDDNDATIDKDTWTDRVKVVNYYEKTVDSLNLTISKAIPQYYSATTKPRTGDLSDVTLYLALFAVTAVILAVLLLTRARKEGSHAE